MKFPSAPKKLERSVEGPLIRWFKKAYPHVKITKGNGMGMRTWPDRIFWLPGGKPTLIELKRPGAQPTPGQLETMAALTTAGYDVQWFDDLEQAKAYLTKKMRR